VRSGQWKLHFKHNYPTPETPGVDGKPGKMTTNQIAQELFDLEEDPGETTPVTEGYVSKRLRALAEKCRRELGDTLAPPTVAEGKELPADIAAFFKVPKEFAGATNYRSPLLFSDGTKARTKADWQKRRREIADFWNDILGPWPPLLSQPKMEVVTVTNRGSITQRHVKVEIAPTQFVAGILLVPKGHGPFPAAVVAYYEPETSVGQSKQTNRDFGYQLARRGFVTLSIGSPGGDSRRPDRGEARCQPLSFLAYVAANCHTALAQMEQVDPDRIGIVGHSYGSKWAMFSSCLYDKFAAAVWCDGGIVFDESRPNVNYWEPWYLGWDPAQQRRPGVPSDDNPRTGPYKLLIESKHDLHELHALMAPRPFLVSGGSEDPPERWEALLHAVAVNKLLGQTNRVGMTNRKTHTPTEESNDQIYSFFEHFLK
jgi:hypothetical protein